MPLPIFSLIASLSVISRNAVSDNRTRNIDGRPRSSLRPKRKATAITACHRTGSSLLCRDESLIPYLMFHRGVDRLLNLCAQPATGFNPCSLPTFERGTGPVCNESSESAAFRLPGKPPARRRPSAFFFRPAGYVREARNVRCCAWSRLESDSDVAGGDPAVDWPVPVAAAC